jgi:CxxC motif-containing protein (DUF1111 family)
VKPAWETLVVLLAWQVCLGAQEERSGGAATVFDSSLAAFALPLPGLPALERRAFAVGNALFNENWVKAPASVTSRDGLGPLFNAPSCSACHLRDGRGQPSDAALLFRLSVPGPQGPLPEPTYGGQLQPLALPGVPAEGKVQADYAEEKGAFADGAPFALRRPTYSFAALNYGPLHPQVMVSPRVAPALCGLGLLEAVPDSLILALADPEDRDGDGISGRPNLVRDPRTRTLRPGRFGWKATQLSLEEQIAGALQEDMGITSPLRPDQNHTAAQRAAVQAPSGGDPEIDAHRLERLVFYTRALGVPAHRGQQQQEVRRGQQLFEQARCSACHLPRLQTGPDALPQLAHQTIYPYTDLLLHDLGEGLADGRPDQGAGPREWRTPPLWGIGLVERVNGHTRFLHDGRARDLAEAILWHGGEASAARAAFARMAGAERQALVAFLNSL